MAGIKLKATAGGSLSLTSDPAQTLDLEYTPFSNNIQSRVLTGAELTAVGIVGLNPEATLWANGDITGSSDEGQFTKFPNGNLEVTRKLTGSIAITSASGSIYISAVLVGGLFPMEFVEKQAENSLLSPKDNSVCWIVQSSNANDLVSWQTFRLADGSTNGGTTYDIHLSAKGRWK